MSFGVRTLILGDVLVARDKLDKETIIVYQSRR